MTFVVNLPCFAKLFCVCACDFVDELIFHHGESVQSGRTNISEKNDIVFKKHLDLGFNTHFTCKLGEILHINTLSLFYETSHLVKKINQKNQ